MATTLADHAKVKALKSEFGNRLRIEGDGGPPPKDCIFVREDRVYDGPPNDRRLIRRRMFIQALNADGKPVSFHGAGWEKNVGERVVRAAPELGAQLTGGELTHRRQKLASIVPALHDNPNMHAIESLSQETPLAANPKASDFTVKNEKTLPTIITWIDASDPEGPQRVIALIEHNVGSIDGQSRGTNRVDMATVSYELSAAEKAALADGDGWKTGYADFADGRSKVEGTNVRVKNVDPNGYIGGKEAAEHHAKTIRSAMGCLSFLNKDFNFQALGSVQMEMVDILQNPVEARVAQDVETGRERVSTAVRAPEVDSGEMRTVSTASVELEYDRNNRLTGSKRTASRVVALYKNIDAEGLNKIKQELSKLHRFVGRIAPERPVTRLRRR